MDYEYLNKEHLKGFDNYKVSVYLIPSSRVNTVEYVCYYLIKYKMSYDAYLLQGVPRNWSGKIVKIYRKFSYFSAMMTGKHTQFVSESNSIAIFTPLI